MGIEIIYTMMKLSIEKMWPSTPSSPAKKYSNYQTKFGKKKGPLSLPLI